MNQAQIAAAAAAAGIAVAAGAQPADVEAAARDAAGATGDAAVTRAVTTARILAAKQLVREEFSLAVAQWQLLRRRQSDSPLPVDLHHAQGSSRVAQDVPFFLLVCPDGILVMYQCLFLCLYNLGKIWSRVAGMGAFRRIHGGVVFHQWYLPLKCPWKEWKASSRQQPNE
ncbi:hypothetical protein C2845_PM13G02710 [Panicum miliaceum]|uniref:Uncharacterized protein n=1 Tax=Panicum miliaceum TaxID=4540 RepID=A0A3L6RJ78_PANMI|nr:hypothetical protein C2845_PM13G02710 [Panicum miliaceum]